MSAQTFIQIVVNGNELQIHSHQSITSLIESYQLPPKRVVVELNGEPLSRDRYPETMLKEGDNVEIVRAVAGG